MTASTAKRAECAVEVVGKGDACEVFVVFDGVRIAKRGRPGTPQARTWVSIEPGFAVYDDATEIVIIRDGVRIQ
jgi:hypothetical protein